MLRNYCYTACKKCGGNCYGCFYAEDCDIWNDVEPYNPVIIAEDIINVALCESRHEIPQAVNGSVFPENIDPTDFNAMACLCEYALNPALNVGVQQINLYVTGLSSALLTVVNYCRERNVKLITYHYNRETGDYLPLPMK